MYAHSAEKSTQSDHKDAQNVETQLKPDKSNVAAAAYHSKLPAHTAKKPHFSETTVRTAAKG